MDAQLPPLPLQRRFSKWIMQFINLREELLRAQLTRQLGWV